MNIEDEGSNELACMAGAGGALNQRGDLGRAVVLVDQGGEALKFIPRMRIDCLSQHVITEAF